MVWWLLWHESVDVAAPEAPDDCCRDPWTDTRTAARVAAGKSAAGTSEEPVGHIRLVGLVEEEAYVVQKADGSPGAKSSPRCAAVVAAQARTSCWVHHTETNHVKRQPVDSHRRSSVARVLVLVAEGHSSGVGTAMAVAASGPVVGQTGSTGIGGQERARMESAHNHSAVYEERCHSVRKVGGNPDPFPASRAGVKQRSQWNGDWHYWPTVGGELAP